MTFILSVRAIGHAAQELPRRNSRPTTVDSFLRALHSRATFPNS